MNHEIRIGLLGAGARLRYVLDRLLAADTGRRVRVAAVSDPDPISIQALRDRLGHEVPALSEAEFLRDPALDWILIGSWNCHHARQAIAALRAGKHVFCEKPLATTLDDALAIRAAAEESGRHFFFGLVLRYSPHYRKIRELLDAGAIGKVVSFEFNETLAFNHGGYIFGNWRRDPEKAGSHLLEKCCHDLDLANWLTGSRPKRAASFGGLNFFRPENRALAERMGPDEEGRTAYGTWSDPHRVSAFDGAAGILDNQVVILEYENGLRATFHTNCNAGIPERRFYFCGTEGALRADLVSGLIEVQRIGWKTEVEHFREIDGDMHGDGDRVMAEALLRTMVDSDPPLSSVREGVESAVSAFGIDAAVSSGRVVDLAPLWQRVDG